MSLLAFAPHTGAWGSTFLLVRCSLLEMGLERGMRGEEGRHLLHTCIPAEGGHLPGVQPLCLQPWGVSFLPSSSQFFSWGGLWGPWASPDPFGRHFPYGTARWRGGRGSRCPVQWSVVSGTRCLREVQCLAPPQVLSWGCLLCWTLASPALGALGGPQAKTTCTSFLGLPKQIHSRDSCSRCWRLEV